MREIVRTIYQQLGRLASIVLLIAVFLPAPGDALAQRDPDRPDFGTLATQSAQIFEDNTRIPYRLRLVAAEYEQAISHATRPARFNRKSCRT